MELIVERINRENDKAEMVRQIKADLKRVPVQVRQGKWDKKTAVPNPLTEPRGIVSKQNEIETDHAAMRDMC